MLSLYLNSIKSNEHLDQSFFANKINATIDNGVVNNLNIIADFYETRDYTIEMDGLSSNTYTQKNGIRQGCPLSPYLFVIVMSAIFSDIRAEHTSKRMQEPIDGIHFSQVLLNFCKSLNHLVFVHYLSVSFENLKPYNF